MPKKLLELVNITKKFAGVVALNSVSLDVRQGEVLALAGENGAGKSTLIKIITGAHAPSEGEVRFEGVPVTSFSPSNSADLGIGVIYQEHNLMQHLTVYENIFFGRELKKGILLDKKGMIDACQKMIDDFNVEINPIARVDSLSIAGQQLVEIIKAVIGKNLKLLIMDEPSAPLTDNEIKKMFSIVQTLRKRGVSIMYISHRLEEIFEIADRVTVLRDGEKIITMNTKDTDIPSLVKNMVGREVGQEYPARTSAIGPEVLKVTDITNKKVKGCSFTLHRGEILGLGGLVGAGRTELVRAIFGADPISHGKIELHGEEIRIKSPRQAIGYRIGLITEDRKHQGLLLNKEIDFNISYGNLKMISKAGIISKNAETKITSKYATEMNVKAYSLSQKVRTLSGGNQQKVVLAKWLATETDILIFDEPTRGIDVSAKSEIYQLMRQLAGNGKSIIMISSEMSELIGMCDRILVMQSGNLTGELEKQQFSQERILELAALKNALN